jgi:lysophospholipase L1-like esterase
MVVGDSLTFYANRDCGLGAAVKGSGASRVLVDGVIGRQTSEAPAVYQPGFGADVVVVGLGTNDTRWTADPAEYRKRIRRLLSTVGPSPTVIWVNVLRRDLATGVQRSAAFNKVLVAEMAARGRRGVVVDWFAAASPQRSWTSSDGVHDTMAGCAARVRMVSAAVARAVTRLS